MGAGVILGGLSRQVSIRWLALGVPSVLHPRGNGALSRRGALVLPLRGGAASSESNAPEQEHGAED
jgi:hypothetical protein